jgi:hypothetical protein
VIQLFGEKCISKVCGKKSDDCVPFREKKIKKCVELVGVINNLAEVNNKLCH